MESLRIQQNQIERIEAIFVNTAGVQLSGLSASLVIRRQSDGQYWSGAGFGAGFSQVLMSAVDATNQGGFYEYTFDTTGLADDSYTLTASGTGAANSPLIGELKVGYYVDHIDASIAGISIGGPTIHLKGVFSKKEKERLIRLVADNFTQMFDLLNAFINKVNAMQERVESFGKDDIKEIKGSLKELGEYVEAQTKLIEAIDSTNDTMEEVKDN